jgi:manganese transport protein
LLYPLFKRGRHAAKRQLHSNIEGIEPIAPNHYKKIAVALDFSAADNKLISHSISQGQNDATYTLIHVVESVPARIYEGESDDLETRKDEERLEGYVSQLQKLGYAAEARLGYGSRAKEIIRQVQESEAELLVIGAHGHSGIKDFLYGETIDKVRHALKIPVLVINV